MLVDAWCPRRHLRQSVLLSVPLQSRFHAEKRHHGEQVLHQQCCCCWVFRIGSSDVHSELCVVLDHRI